ncbi:NEL-type E3 ubiquitin ligase domain-containing protein [Pseudomonas sp. NPDC089401]|uniref:NEL-type E3 ubiquitin ligase domain-containing protein n=1 Tax=Pseudomonas sp. NPDC089401 TaxID=3364462 RepID=UPI00380F46D0
MPPESQPASLPHHGLIERKLPAWIKTTPALAPDALRAALEAAPASLEEACLRHPEVAKALADEHERFQASALAAKALFSTLPDLETFATQQLTAAIKETFELEIDVANTYLFDAIGHAHQKQLGAATPETFVRSLKHHALQNFESASTEKGGMDVSMPQARSVILDQRGYMKGPPFENALDIEPTAFAALCRKLDIGGQYQALIDAIYYPAAPTQPGQPSTWQAQLGTQAAVLDTLGQVERSAFRQSLHAACLQARVGKAAYHAILATPLETLEATAPACCSFLQLWQTELHGLLLIQFKELDCVVLYTPHAADAPLQEYASLPALLDALRDAAQQDLTALTRHIPDARKAHLSAKLEDHLRPLTFTLKNVYERVADPQAKLPLVPRPFNRPFQAEVLYQNFTRLRDDARHHAVPTVAMDARTFHARLAYFESIAFSALNVVGFVVPEVGSLLLAATVWQLGHEVYEGIESWNNDDRQQAYAYLLDVMGNIALLAISAAGAHAIKAGPGGSATALKPAPAAIEPPSFIEELVEVELPDGSTRLWNADLTPYQQDLPQGAGLKPDALGLYRQDGKVWLRLDNKTYSLKWRPATGTYHIEHPNKPLAHEPALRHNGNGTWLHALDRPRTWQTRQLFQRLGHQADLFDDEDALRILEVSGIDEGALRRAVSDNLPIPAPLADTLQRFKLARETLEAMGNATAAERQAAFAERYRQLPFSQAPGAAVLHRIYPRLPGVFVDELLQHSNSNELTALLAGRLPRRIGEEARLMQQQLRLMRAYEGVYLQTVDNPDTDRLLLHSLPRLPGWSADTAIELHRGSMPASKVDGIGPEGIAGSIIRRTATGYSLAADGRPDSTHASLADALFAALPDGQRQALLPSGVVDAQTLADHLAQAPMLPRWALRKALKMQRPGPRSPMRLADGRLGYRLSGDGRLPQQPSRASLLEQLDDMTLAPEFTVSSARILEALETAGRSPEQIQLRIEQLRAERQELRQSLDDAFTGPGQISALGARRANREEIELALWQHWIHSAVPELDESVGILRLASMFIAEFPRHLPAFIGSRVSRLQLADITLDYIGNDTLAWTDFEAQLNNVFQHFPQLSALDIDRGYDPLARASGFANSLPLIVRCFPQLGELRLVNQNMTLYPLDLERFASREHLHHLDLSGNRLAAYTLFRFPDLPLEYLGLDRMALPVWPEWLDDAALERIRTLSLRDNQLAQVPALLSINAERRGPETSVLLDGNPLRPARLLDLYLTQGNPQRRFRFSLDNSEVIQQYQGLRQTIDQWTTSPGRASIGQSILAIWERRVRDDSLSPWLMEEVSLEDFPPTLPDFFSRYADIVRLNRVQATVPQLDQWLRRFPGITTLRLDGHIQPLSSLPEALTHLPVLSRLSLLDQGLELDDQAMRVIARMPALRELDLSGNRISGQLTDLSSLRSRLDRLALRNMALEGWPLWLNSLMPRYVLDLQGNRLTTLPQAILDNPPSTSGTTAILLTDNPLTTQTLRSAHLSQRYDRSFTFDMDLPFEILNASPLGLDPGAAFGNSLGSFGSVGSTTSSGSFHRHGFAPWAQVLQPDVSLWLEGAAGLRHARDSLWQTLLVEADAENLLQLVAQLSTAAPYRNPESRAGFIERVWRVLEMAANRPQEREVFDALARDAITEGTCPDGMLLQFQQIEQKYLVCTATQQASGAGREADFYHLLRRLFRQQRLDEIASARSRHQDAAEVRLAYRRLLAERLDLLTPGDEMMFGADVSSAQATSAALAIWEAEDGEALITFARDTPFWTDYLREAYAGSFASIEQRFQTAVNDLQSENPQSTLEELAAPTRALESQRDQEQGDLIDELTFRIRADHP